MPQRIAWTFTEDGVWIGERGGNRGVIKDDDLLDIWYVTVLTADGRRVASADLATVGQAIDWVEQELVRLANTAQD